MKLKIPATTVVVRVIHDINANPEKILMFYGIVDQLLAVMVMILDVSGTFSGKSLSEALLFVEHVENMLCTKIVLNVRKNFCTQNVLPRFELGIFMY